MQNLTWTAYQQITKAHTKQLSKLIDELLERKEQGKQETGFYKVRLDTLKNDFPQDAQDFIEYYNL